MEFVPRVQIHQYNDPAVLEFFIKSAVEYRLVGDHLFIIRSRGRDVAAGPGDWLVVRPDGEVAIERGDYALRAERAIAKAGHARRKRIKGALVPVARGTRARFDRGHAASAASHPRSSARITSASPK